MYKRQVAALIEQNSCYYRLQYYYIQEEYTTIIETAKAAQQLNPAYLALEKALIFSYHLAAAYFNQAATETSYKSTADFQQALDQS